MKKTYIIPATEAIKVLAEEMVASSPLLLQDTPASKTGTVLSREQTNMLDEALIISNE